MGVPMTKQASIHLIFRATLSIYAQAATKATQTLVRSWPVLGGGVIFCVLYMLGPQLLPGWQGPAPTSSMPTAVAYSGQLALVGFMAAFIQIALLALFYNWLSKALGPARFGWQDLFEYDIGTFFNVLGCAFLLWILEMLLGVLLGNLMWLIYLAYLLGLNPLPEVVYQRQESSMQALGSSVEFMRDNGVEWFLPQVVMMVPLLLIFGPIGFQVLMVGGQELLFPGTVPLVEIQILSDWLNISPIIGFIIGSILAVWYMFFRGALFQVLDGSSRRQRLYRFQHDLD